MCWPYERFVNSLENTLLEKNVPVISSVCRLLCLSSLNLSLLAQLTRVFYISSERMNSNCIVYVSRLFFLSIFSETVTLRCFGSYASVYACATPCDHSTHVINYINFGCYSHSHISFLTSRPTLVSSQMYTNVHCASERLLHRQPWIVHFVWATVDKIEFKSKQKWRDKTSNNATCHTHGHRVKSSKSANTKRRKNGKYLIGRHCSIDEAFFVFGHTFYWRKHYARKFFENWKITKWRARCCFV